GTAVRRALLREERVARHPARRLQTKLPTGAQRTLLHAADDADMSDKRFHGIYPGRVESNIDPLNMSRIQVSVSDVGGKQILSWPRPCLPVTGQNMGMFTVPPNGAAVWVQFARGDTDYPIWLGGYYANGQAPALSRQVPPGISGVTLQTQLGN